MWTTVLVITLYNSVWCIHGHIQCFKCNTIFYFRKLQALRSALGCGKTCGMHVFADFVDKFFGHLRHAIRYGHGNLPRGSQILTKCYQYIHLRSDTNFRPATQGASYNLTKSATAKSLTNNAGPRPRPALWSVVEDMKIFYSYGKCPLDGTWCQRNNCQSSHKGEITPEETNR